MEDNFVNMKVIKRNNTAKILISVLTKIYQDAKIHLTGDDF